MKFITLLLLASAANTLSARGIDDCVDALANMPGYRASATYSVTLPQAQDDIVYTVDLAQDPAEADSYLLQWSVMSPSGPVSGFTAWFDGNFYNFRNHRLQERHDDRDPETPAGTRAPQNAAQFASLLPTRIAQWLREVQNEPNTAATLSEQGNELILTLVRQPADEIESEITWTFELPSMRPLKFYADYNPGSISGQQVNAVYAYGDSLAPLPAGLNEAYLRGLFPDAFEKYRESQFAVENMRGLPLPAFSLPKIGGGRLARQASDAFRAPTAVVFFDPAATLTPELIKALRGAVDRLPVDAEIIWASTEKNPDAAAQLLEPLRPGETALTGANSLALACGTAALPTILVCTPKGEISNIITGLNQNLQSDVMQLLTTAK